METLVNVMCVIYELFPNSFHSVRDQAQLSQTQSNSKVCRCSVILTARILEKRLEWGKLNSKGTWSNFLLSLQ